MTNNITRENISDYIDGNMTDNQLKELATEILSDLQSKNNQIKQNPKKEIVKEEIERSK